MTELADFIDGMARLRGRACACAPGRLEDVHRTIVWNVFQAHAAVLGRTPREVESSEYRTMDGRSMLRVAIGTEAEHYLAPALSSALSVTGWLTFFEDKYQLNYWPDARVGGALPLSDLIGSSPRPPRDTGVHWIEAETWREGRYAPALVLDVTRLAALMMDKSTTLLKRVDQVARSYYAYVFSKWTSLSLRGFSTPNEAHAVELSLKGYRRLPTQLRDFDIDRITLHIQPSVDGENGDFLGRKSGSPPPELMIDII